MNAHQNETTKPPLKIVYDGECPFCTNYVRHTRLQDRFGAVDLIDAREEHPDVAALREQGFDLNEGMAVIHDGHIHYGADAMHFLALTTTRSDAFNRASAFVFSKRWLSRLLYPALKLGRRATLTALGRKPINSTPNADA